MDHDEPHDQHAGRRSLSINIALVAFLAIAGFYLVTEHRAHLYGVLYWLLPLILVGLHFWMHAGHRHGKHREDHRDRSGT